MPNPAVDMMMKRRSALDRMAAPSGAHPAPRPFAGIDVSLAEHSVDYESAKMPRTLIHSIAELLIRDGKSSGPGAARVIDLPRQPGLGKAHTFHEALFREVWAEFMTRSSDVDRAICCRIKTKTLTDGAIPPELYGSNWSFKKLHIDREALLFSHLYGPVSGFTGGALHLVDIRSYMHRHKLRFDDVFEWSAEPTPGSKPVLSARHQDAALAECGIDLGAPGPDQVIFVNNMPGAGILHGVTPVVVADPDNFIREYHRCSVKEDPHQPRRIGRGAMNSTVARRTAIVATIGSASEKRACIEGLILAGVDIVRLSMCNGTRERHVNTARIVREVSAEHGRKVRLLADLQGRKNRLGALPGGRAEWAVGDTVVLTTRPASSTSHSTWVSHPWPSDGVSPGNKVLIDDGAVLLVVVEAGPEELLCEVIDGGPVTDGRGVTMPNVARCSAGLVERDIDDLHFARRLGVDMVALSFASKEDHAELRALAKGLAIIGKEEHPDAVNEIPAMADAFDGLMVARGDLALEIPFEDVPIVQKRIVAECASRGRLSMVATQLLHSMRHNARPTRAEVSDIANAVLDGADALVLAGETGFGQHPVQVVDVMRRVIERAELYRDDSV
ncbi:pyruvate kinase [Wenjunlia tyrosinilytica]|uniref:Pyruvate kinase n=1 Tax=Wenjunlia tyrosinilytica TaxID=1544741 RepID=A0A917ZL70_9ACTN|nr:pyruvate kinase [Wenjunlia tyrosinilytica]GGO84874.1 hypothetical protein GCM10012280_17350 [Wenjunlia tyrosinilytica]